MSVRLVAHDHPETREVFRRYGEEDAREVFGHLEPLSAFARRRGVPLDRLLEEIASAAGLGIDGNARRGEGLHRPLVRTALCLTLTLGAGWGACLLAKIGLGGTFEAAPAAHVIGHGEAQLWGFAGIFLVGIALRYLPSATARPSPSPAAWGFLLSALVAGVLGGFAWSLAPAAVPFLGPTSGVALLAGTAVYLLLAGRFLTAKRRASWTKRAEPTTPTIAASNGTSNGRRGCSSPPSRRRRASPKEARRRGCAPSTGRHAA